MVLNSFTGGISRLMACIPLRSQPRRPVRSSPSVSSTISQWSSWATSCITRRVFPVRL